MTDTREAFKPADNYEGLLIQAKALHRLRVSHKEQLSHYIAIDYSLSDAKMNELTESIESEKQMNHILTNENESYKERIAELGESNRHLRDLLIDALDDVGQELSNCEMKLPYRKDRYEIQKKLYNDMQKAIAESK